jgi:lysophospholipase L1-like esterase
MRSTKFALVLAACLAAPAFSANLANGDKVAFLGDSITQFGAGSQTGYVNLVDSGLKANGIDLKLVRAGISGHKSNQMLARLEKDVLRHKPTWMLLSCGVNDVMHGKRGVPLEPYKQNITKIVDQAQAAGVKVMILTATMIKEDSQDQRNLTLAAYNDFLRGLAREKHCPLADLNRDMQADVAKLKAAGHKGNVLTRDGVHMNPFGDVMMARGILRAFGLDDAQLQKAEAAWQQIPVIYSLRPWRTSHASTPSITLNLKQVQALQERARQAGKSYDQFFKDILQEALEQNMADIVSGER